MAAEAGLHASSENLASVLEAIIGHVACQITPHSPPQRLPRKPCRAQGFAVHHNDLLYACGCYLLFRGLMTSFFWGAVVPLTPGRTILDELFIF